MFTNFWDANILAQDKHLVFCFHESPEIKKYYVAWLRNFQVYSIALGIPDSSKIPFLKNIFRLNHFCPTYNLLMSYKEDADWEKYRITYRQLLVSRKEEINDWINDLEQDKVYILCCWEDTSKKCNCHRKILFDALRSTSIWKDKATWIYRHGNSKYCRFAPSVSAKDISQQLGLTDTEPELISVSNEFTAIYTPYVPLYVSSPENLSTSSYTFNAPNSSNVTVITNNQDK